MQLNFDLLEQQRLEDGISAAQKAGDYEVSTRLSGERAELTDRIAHAGVASSRLTRCRSFHTLGTLMREPRTFPLHFGIFSGPIHPTRCRECLRMTKEELEEFLAEGLSLDRIGTARPPGSVDREVSPEETRSLAAWPRGPRSQPEGRSRCGYGA